MKKYKMLIIIALLSLQVVFAQEWQRETFEPQPFQLFKSVEVFNLPTTESLDKGDLYFHISHKFRTPTSEGLKEFFGFDGGVNMRLALGYAITDKLLVTLGRTNYDGNVDFNIKHKLYRNNSESYPWAISLVGGTAYSSKVLGKDVYDNSRFWSFYAMVPFNIELIDNLLLGVVPTFVYNPVHFTEDSEHTLALGSYLQYYLSKRWSVLVEANNNLDGWKRNSDSYSIGAEIETAGHFFKFYLSNNTFTNTVHFIPGTDTHLGFKNLHLVFLITRIL